MRWRVSLSNIIFVLVAVGFSPHGFAEMKLIPTGDFNMPAMKEKKSRHVQSFWMDEHPVTNQEYLSFVESHPEWKKSQIKKLFADQNYLEYWKTDSNFGGPSLAKSPVTRVSWYAARAYCDSLQKRLATIDEWEYVGTIPFKKGKSIQSLILEW
ncbi:MAG TPA: formylglycine-generating enzyme family protein, partial [Bdellovibrio sp.]|nr:formylglycine-generating enzyme family protein [Bdellovibrio sp.]